VVSEAPLSSIFGNSDTTDRVTKWAIGLAAFEVMYKPKVVVKSHTLVDFLVDWTESSKLSMYLIHHTKCYTLTVPSKSGDSGAGVILKSPKGDKLKYVVQIRQQYSQV
jgi:HJR/Mrr/RecB family endonuclease